MGKGKMLSNAKLSPPKLRNDDATINFRMDDIYDERRSLMILLLKDGFLYCPLLIMMDWRWWFMGIY